MRREASLIAAGLFLLTAGRASSAEQSRSVAGDAQVLQHEPAPWEVDVPLASPQAPRKASSVLSACSSAGVFVTPIIDFEEPDLVEPDPVFDQFPGVLFEIVMSADPCGPAIGLPELAEVGAPGNAFQGPPFTNRPECGVLVDAQPDMPAAGEPVGCKFISWTQPGLPPSLRLSFAVPVRRVAGVILDIDSVEEWIITPYRGNTPGPSVMLMVGDPGTGDGLATPWEVSVSCDDAFDKLILEPAFDNSGFGFAVDNLEIDCSCAMGISL